MIPLLAAVAIAVAVAVAAAAGYAWGRRGTRSADPPASEPHDAIAPESAAAIAPGTFAPSAAPTETTEPAPGATASAVAERARLIRSFEGECDRLRQTPGGHDAAVAHLTQLAEERRTLFHAIAQARTDVARYRQLVIDIENNAPPPLLGGPGTPDDLKLIVGVGPVLERMLHQLGITTYRQIARWTERDIDEFDARLNEFPGRIRRDGWVTQARSLHQSTYGESLPSRDAG